MHYSSDRMTCPPRHMGTTSPIYHLPMTLVFSYKPQQSIRNITSCHMQIVNSLTKIPHRTTSATFSVICDLLLLQGGDWYRASVEIFCKSKSSIVAFRHGNESKEVTFERRFSIRICSSFSLAKPFPLSLTVAAKCYHLC